MIYLKAVLMLFLFFSNSISQIKVIKNEKIPITPSESWSNPRFSADGKSIFFTTFNYSGIWRYTLENKNVDMITEDQGSGYGYDVSQNGEEIVYRRNIYNTNERIRNQEIIHKNLKDNSYSILEKGKDISIPVLINGTPCFSAKGKSRNIPQNNKGIRILGIENTKIAVLKNNEITTFDPIKNGSYIWASLSPDMTKISAYEMDNGTFVCDLQGKILSRLGRCDAPSWTRNGKWLVYMKVIDDGHKIISSDLYMKSASGGQAIQLTNTGDISEMYPCCSLTENKIVYSTSNGELFILTYEENEK